MSIAITKYRVVAYDKDGNTVCQGITKNEDCRVFVDRVLNRYWDLSSHAMGIAALQKMAITPVDALEYCEAIPKQPK